LPALAVQQFARQLRSDGLLDNVADYQSLCGVPSPLGIFAFVVLERLGNPPLTPMNIGSRPARIAEARIPEPPTGRVIPVTSDDPVREVHQMELNWGANHREKTTGELRTVTNPNGERLPSRE
jgi:hypothetical protein